MDDRRFDSLTKVLGAGHTRRGLPRLLGGLSLGGLLSARTAQDAAARGRKGGALCTRNRQCKTRQCVGPVGNKRCTCSPKFPACQQPENRCAKATCLSDGTCTEDWKNPGATCGTNRVCCAPGTCCPAGQVCKGESIFVAECCTETKTCTTLDVTCGTWAGDCGPVNCGGCPTGQTCNGGACG
jgi:hypothetical protein